jgi:flagellar hook-basal body complex protein FliE
MPGAIGAAGAAAAYRTATSGGGPAEAANSFGAVMQRAMEQAVELGRQSDATSTAALSGQGSVTDVVLAVSRAELALQTSVAIRDRVVAAYQEVMRMPI